MKLMAIDKYKYVGESVCDLADSYNMESVLYGSLDEALENNEKFSDYGLIFAHVTPKEISKLIDIVKDTKTELYITSGFSRENDEKNMIKAEEYNRLVPLDRIEEDIILDAYHNVHVIVGTDIRPLEKAVYSKSF